MIQILAGKSTNTKDDDVMMLCVGMYDPLEVIQSIRLVGLGKRKKTWLLEELGVVNTSSFALTGGLGGPVEGLKGRFV